MRLHAGILACVHEIPYIPVSYGPKTEELINMFSIEHLAMNVADINLELFISRWNMFIRDYDIEKRKMSEVHIILRDALIEKLKNI
jgi:polysaccharide pyruvyl transferase WcaK-like protein